MRNTVPWMLLSAVVVSAGGAFLLEHREHTALEHRVSALESELASERAELERVRRELAEAESKAPAAPAAGAGFLATLLGGSAPQAGDATDSDDAQDENSGSGLAQLMESMVGGEFFEQIQGQMARQQVAELDQAVELSNREREEIEALFAAQADQAVKMSAKMFGGEEFDPDEFDHGDYVNESAELRRILGDRRYDDYLEAQDRRQEQQREIGFQTQYRFFAGEVGLAPEQHDAIEPLLREYSSDGQPDFEAADLTAEGEALSMRELMRRSTERQQERYGELREELTAHLDDDQLRRFDLWREKQEAQSQMVLTFMPDVTIPAFE